MPVESCLVQRLLLSAVAGAFQQSLGRQRITCHERTYRSGPALRLNPNGHESRIFHLISLDQDRGVCVCTAHAGVPAASCRGIPAGRRRLRPAGHGARSCKECAIKWLDHDCNANPGSSSSQTARRHANPLVHVSRRPANPCYVSVTAIQHTITSAGATEKFEAGGAFASAYVRCSAENIRPVW